MGFLVQKGFGCEWGLLTRGLSPQSASSCKRTLCQEDDVDEGMVSYNVRDVLQKGLISTKGP
eukprot:160433-Amphidinium_carterae.1